ncbi:hypothetical protein BRW84_07765 [Oxalobacter formigenes OXCC13]|nr:hypothetical protein BRW84_07765 [Oxalobacter formigenes OXCC13]
MIRQKIRPSVSLLHQYLNLILKQTFCPIRYKTIESVKKHKKASTVFKTINAPFLPKTCYPE